MSPDSTMRAMEPHEYRALGMTRAPLIAPLAFALAIWLTSSMYCCVAAEQADHGQQSAAATNGVGVSGKLGTVTVSTKQNEYPVVSYSFRLDTNEKRIKRPCVSCYILVEHPDTTRSTHFADYNPSWRWDQSLRSKQEPDVDASTIKSVRGKTSGCPFYPTYTFKEKDRILVLRVELWQDGVLLDTFVSKSDADLQKLGILNDWYCKKL